MSRAIRKRRQTTGWRRALLAAALGVLLLGGKAEAQALEADGGSAVVQVLVVSAADGDMDGLSDAAELGLGTDSDRADTDGDGLPDGYEIWNALDPLNFSDASADVDIDGLDNISEYEWASLPFVADTDEDGYWDGIEVARGADPTLADSHPVRSQPADVSCDGRLDAMDLQIVINAALGLAVPVPANVNAVEGVDAADVQTVINALLGTP